MTNEYAPNDTYQEAAPSVPKFIAVAIKDGLVELSQVPPEQREVATVLNTEIFRIRRDGVNSDSVRRVQDIFQRYSVTVHADLIRALFINSLPGLDQLSTALTESNKRGIYLPCNPELGNYSNKNFTEVSQLRRERLNSEIVELRKVSQTLYFVESASMAPGRNQERYGVNTMWI